MILGSVLPGTSNPLPSNNERQHKSHTNLKSETPMHITPQSLLLKSYALHIQSPNRLRVSRLASSLKPRTLHPTYSQALPGETEDFGEATDELIRFKRVHQVTTGLRVQGCFFGVWLFGFPVYTRFQDFGLGVSDLTTSTACENRTLTSWPWNASIFRRVS